jgi:carboxyl-terminal processing protease
LGELLAARPSGLLLDLRANGGGLLEPTVEVAGFFLGGGPVVLESRPDGQEKLYQAPGPAITELPMVVVVDRGSASATEVLAAALRDLGRAELVGERTYGKNTVQYIHRLSDGSGLRITVAEWRTPSGQPIPPTGLAPDWAVASPNSQPPGADFVLEAAARLLLERVREGTRPAA